MGKKTIYAIVVLAVLLAALFAVSVYALPDNPPTCSLSSNTVDTTTTAVLTAVSVDTLSNAGVSSIKFYEDGVLIYTKSCGLATTCVGVKTIVHTTDGSHNYYAVARDRAGQETRSSTIRIDFEGMNRPPVIDTATPSSPTTIDEDETETFRITAHDPDGDSLSYSWKVDGIAVLGVSGTSFDFNRNVDGDSETFVLSAYVSDGNGGYDVTAWTINVNDLEPEVALVGDDSLTECDDFEFTAVIDSYDDITSIDWDFGDGATQSGTDASVSHQFPEDGDYTVTVTVTDADGDTATDDVSVEVLDIAPEGVDAGEDQNITEGDIAFFHGEATMPCSSDVIDSWEWDFGDGNTASGQDVDNLFEEDGAYTVTLTVCDDDGSCVSDTLEVIAEDTEPTADFDFAPENPIEGDTVDFTDTTDSYDDIVSWAWEFGDGDVSGDQNPSHQYDLEGDYEVCLTVEDEDGDFDTHCEIVPVGNNVPEVLLVADTTSGDEALDVHFDCVIVGGGNAPFEFVIDFGDGSVPEPSASADHTYTHDGVYTAMCTVMDVDGDIASDDEDITVFNVEPVVDIVLNSTSGTEALDVHADCFVTDGNAPFNYTIDFGDGTVIDADSADHTFDQNGTYEVICTVTDVDGDVVSDSEIVDVFDTEPLADFDWSPVDPEEHDVISFDADVVAYDTPVEFEWDFDADGVTDDTVESPDWTYTSGGDYDVTLTVTDADGSVTVVTHTVHVASNPPEAELYVDPLSGDEPLVVDVDCSGIGGDAPLSYEIDFGDGSAPFSGAVTTHTFDQNGTYNVTCTVSDVDGDSSTDSETVDVFDTVPDVSFVFSPADPMEGDTVWFDATIDAYDTPLDIEWDFGDGHTELDVVDITHVFDNDGSYPVTLTVTDADGSVGSYTLDVNVSVNAADVMLVANTTLGYEALDVEFACVAMDGNPPFEYELDFGDGTATSSSASETHTYDQNGTYTVTCTVTDDDGDVTSDFVIVEVLDTEPVVSFDFTPVDPVEGDTVDFDGTIDAYDTPVVWEWDFDGDGVADSTDEDPSWIFDLEGDYNVTLTATDADGSVVVFWDVVSVGNNEPFVNLLADPLSGPENVNVTFNCTVTNGNGPLTFEMDYGDSSPINPDQDSVHQYASPGSYTATCTVTDVDGDTDSDFVIINVANNAPNVTLSADDVNPTEGQLVDFECGITDGDEPYTVLMDFGDGTSTTDPTEDHEYILEGLYTVSCTVSDADGDIGYDELDIDVSNNEPVVNLDTNVTSGSEPLSVSYNCTVGAGNEPFSYVIDFGDGTPTSSSPTGTHDYPTPGTYPMTCTVTDVDGDWDDDAVGIHVMDNPPVVDLVVTPGLAGVEGDSFHFDCLVTGGDAPLTYSIDFGDGTSTASDSADHVYGLEGIYNATCTVSDFDGDVDSDSELIDIANNPPIVNLIANVTSGLEPLTVNFTCVVGAGNEPFSFSIDFGDGTAPVASDMAVHTYPTEGAWDATCTVIDTDGDLGDDLQHIEVINNPPVVDLVAIPTSGLEGMNVSFTCNVAGGNEPFSYVLDFGDGFSTTDSSAWHAYPLEGEYNATCTVSDFDGDVDVDAEIITVANNPPSVNLVTNVSSGFEPLSVNYTCGVGGGNAPLTYVIDFGDGSPSSSSTTGTHDYLTPGVYSMTCTVTDVDGDVDFDTVGIHVLDNVPDVTLVATPSVGTEGMNVSFECLVADGNAPFTYLLDFGDGTSTTSDTAWHAYPLEGDYNASCIVTDADFDTGSDWTWINVSNNPPVVNLDVNVTSGLEPLSVNYTCNVGGGNPPLGYTIDFGDGTPSSSSATGTHDYPLPGDYVMTCTVTDTDGDSDFDTVAIEVLNNAPVVTLIATPTIGLEGMNVSFDCSAVGGNDPLSYIINFGDGTSVGSSTGWHVYPLEGDFNASCTVTDADLDTGSDWTWINVSNNVPVVNLVTNVTDGVEPLDVFLNCTLVGGGNEPFSYEIDFGDGSAHAFTQTATHTYPNNRTSAFDATCTITDTDGDVSVPDTVSIDVYDSEPDTNFTFTPSSPIEGDTVVFTDASSAYDMPLTWAWDFGDGNTSTLQNPTKDYDLEGSYLVTLCTTDNDGSTTCHSELVVVGNNVPVVDVTVVPTSGTEPLGVTVTCAVTSGGNAPFTYNVLYGDGDSTTSTFSAHTYDQDGLFPVTCMVTDVDGDIASDLEMVTVDDTVPTADFSFAPLNPEAGDTVDFTDLSTAYDTPLTWSWDFQNDGTPDDTVQNPSFVFPSPGLYVVNLTVTDDDGSTASAIRTVAVNVSTPAPIIFGVSAADITNTSANITWGTDQSSDSLVEWGLTDALGSSLSDASMVFSHGVLLSGLAPNTTYYFNVTSCNAFADCTTEGPFNFTTLATSVGDTTPPVVTLLSPADGSVDIDGNFLLVYNVTDDIDDPLSCDVWSNVTGTWQIDVAAQWAPNGTGNSVGYSGTADGTYAWNVECSDGFNSAWGSVTDWTVIVSVPAPLCGDGSLDLGEQCDDSNNINGDGCSAVCVNETCGDGTLQSLFEQCDDGNLLNGDGCSDTCAIETIPLTCGDGIIDLGEECDGGALGGFTCNGLDAFTGGSLSCTPACTFNTTACTGGSGTGICGDGVVNVGESCDGADWGPISGCSDFGYTGGSLSCSATCSFSTALCTSTSGTIINSWIYGGWYPNNVEGDVTETTVLSTSMLNSTVQGTPVTTIDMANLTYAILTNVSPISNCTVIGTPTNYSVLSDSPCVNVYIDPSNVENSDTTGSTVMNSNITDSDATYSSISDSIIQDSHFSHCTVTNSHLDEVVGYMCTIIDSTVTRSTVDSSTVDGGSVVTDSTIINGSDVTNSVVTDSTIDNSTVTDSTVDNSNVTDSTVTDSTIIDSTIIRSDVDNSTVINSTLVDMIVDDAWIEDGVIYNGTISDDVFYNATEDGPANLTDVVNYPPVAVISTTATSGVDSLAVDFSAAGSSDPNIPGPLNDSLSYAWDFTTDGTTDATNVSASNTFGVGTYTVTLAVTDSFGRQAFDTVVITVTSSGSTSGTTGGSSGGGGGGGGRTGDTYILVLTEDEPSKTLHLKTADTVKYVHNGEEFSFIMRYIYADKAKMGVSQAASYQQYTVDELKKYNLNLDDDPASDISVTPGVLYSGAGDFTFSLANAAPKKPIVVLPVGSVDRRVVGVEESSAELEGEPEEVIPAEEETFSEGVLEFVESMSVKSSAPLWAGVGLALLIILLGLGIYFLVVRKEE